MDTPTTPDQDHGSDVARIRADYEAVKAELVTYDETCEALEISRYTLSRLVRNGRVDSVQIGRQRYITRASLIEYIKNLHEAVRTPSTRRPAAVQPARSA